MDDRALAFIEQNPGASMITLRRDGTPHAVRIGVAVVDGKIWSSGTQTRLRTKHLRRDPRATLFVFEGGPGAYRSLTLECTVTILDGPDAPELNLKLMQNMQAGMPNPPQPGRVMWFGQEKTVEEFIKTMVDEQRLVYEFAVNRVYGMY